MPNFAQQRQAAAKQAAKITSASETHKGNASLSYSGKDNYEGNKGTVTTPTNTGYQSMKPNAAYGDDVLGIVLPQRSKSQRPSITHKKDNKKRGS